MSGEPCERFREALRELAEPDQDPAPGRAAGGVGGAGPSLGGLRDHAAECPRCAEELRTYCRTIELLRSLPAVEVPDGFLDWVREGIDTDVRPLHGGLRRVGSWAIAAAVPIVGVLTVWLATRPAPDPGPAGGGTEVVTATGRDTSRKMDGVSGRELASTLDRGPDREVTFEEGRLREQESLKAEPATVESLAPELPSPDLPAQGPPAPDSPASEPPLESATAWTAAPDSPPDSPHPDAPAGIGAPPAPSSGAAVPRVAVPLAEPAGDPRPGASDAKSGRALVELSLDPGRERIRRFRVSLPRERYARLDGLQTRLRRRLGVSGWSASPAETGGGTRVAFRIAPGRLTDLRREIAEIEREIEREIEPETRKRATTPSSERAEEPAERAKGSDDRTLARAAAARPASPSGARGASRAGTGGESSPPRPSRARSLRVETTPRPAETTRRARHTRGASPPPGGGTVGGAGPELAPEAGAVADGDGVGSGSGGGVDVLRRERGPGEGEGEARERSDAPLGVEPEPAEPVARAEARPRSRPRGAETRAEPPETVRVEILFVLLPEPAPSGNPPSELAPSGASPQGGDQRGLR